MSALEAPASQKALNYWLTLAEKLGEPTNVVPGSVKECSTEIDRLRMLIPATEGQINLCEKLISDHFCDADGVPTRALPHDLSTKTASDWIENLTKRRPTQRMLQRLRALELQIDIDNPNLPKTTKSLYDRERDAKNLIEGGDLFGQLLDAKDAIRNDWDMVDAALTVINEETPEEAEPEEAEQA